MVVLRFTTMFDKVRSGEKKQTIRPIENYKHLKPGDKVHCYSTEKRKGVSRPVTKELLYVGICVEISEIMWDHFKWSDRIAGLDGFKDAVEMRRWFEERYGQDLYPRKQFRIIRWE